MTFQPGQSGNPAGRPKGSINKNLAMLREAVEKVLPLVVDRALAGDAEAQKLILERGLPKLRPVDAPMEFSLPEEDTASPARAVLLQAAEGSLPLSCAKEISQMLTTSMQQESYSQKPGLSPAQPANAYLCSLHAQIKSD